MVSITWFSSSSCYCNLTGHDTNNFVQLFFPVTHTPNAELILSFLAIRRTLTKRGHSLE